MFVIITAEDNQPKDILGVYLSSDLAFDAYRKALKNRFAVITNETIEDACDAGFEPIGNDGFIAILDLSNAEVESGLPTIDTLLNLLGDLMDECPPENDDNDNEGFWRDGLFYPSDIPAKVRAVLSHKTKAGKLESQVAITGSVHDEVKARMGQRVDDHGSVDVCQITVTSGTHDNVVVLSREAALRLMNQLAEIL